jgi:prevent-host-death family protein
MKIAPVADVKAHLSGYIEETREEPVVITKNGRPVAMLVAVSNEDEGELERLVLAHSPRFRRLLERAEESIREGRGIRHDDLWTSLPQDGLRTEPVPSEDLEAGYRAMAEDEEREAEALEWAEALVEDATDEMPPSVAREPEGRGGG